ncbi:MAG: SDR family oxidoreductase [Chloroflexota bacterium]|nr:SDR family oxidoreductase [Chloroflexota bacterium]MDE2839156.1 SDR family oxidoreductase [Chloroflexota bacterium]MDE2929515.1 SDR family oxidoreductase [Chloroflexota bacterium]
MTETGIDGKVALVTGGNHGIGAVIAQALAAQGVKVLITYFRLETAYAENELQAALDAGIGGDRLYRAQQQQSADHVVSAIRKAGGTATAVELDLSDSDAIPSLFDRCEAQLGPVEILINNHAYCAPETFDPANVGANDSGSGITLTSAEGIDQHMAVNVRATVLLMREFVERHIGRRADWGRIVNISTDAAHAHGNNVSYAASKHAIESYSRSAASELGQYGITVNIVAPGPIQTGYITPAMEREIEAETPLGRVGRPEDIAHTVVFLVSEQGGWLTGQLLYVGGGYRMHQ